MSRRRRRRARDKWRSKVWYRVFSPKYFGEVELFSIPVTEGQSPVGRTVEATLYDLTGDPAHQTIIMKFQINGVKELRADTFFKGHEYARDYLRSLTRRGSSKIDAIINVKTRDGVLIRVYPMACTAHRVKTSQQRAIRKVMFDIVEEKAKNLNFDQFVQEMILGKIASDIYNEAKKIAPLRHVGFRKSKVLSPGEAFKPKPEPQTTPAKEAEA
ncbi:MAG: 30S ribosomal protein S3Ae [Candidatus Bathyarchaeota archaeon B24]|nr:MAG: 30S ribosomal protein S3Ae [Candidatus Bathyarchaeota archaeon B24]RLI25872.1 MAG: 30S ribosomal protein S3ae [Candidatus Bathyarchaeota archaeon]